MKNYARNVTDEIPKDCARTRLYGFGLATVLLVGLAMSGDRQGLDVPEEVPALRPTGRVLLDVDLDAPADVGFTIPEEISEELWMDAWGAPHIPDGSAIILEGDYTGDSFQARLVEDFSAQGTFEEVSSIETAYQRWADDRSQSPVGLG